MKHRLPKRMLDWLGLFVLFVSGAGLMFMIDYFKTLQPGTRHYPGPDWNQYGVLIFVSAVAPIVGISVMNHPRSVPCSLAFSAGAAAFACLAPLLSPYEARWFWRPFFLALYLYGVWNWSKLASKSKA